MCMATCTVKCAITCTVISTNKSKKMGLYQGNLSDPGTLVSESWNLRLDVGTEKNRGQRVQGEG